MTLRTERRGRACKLCQIIRNRVIRWDAGAALLDGTCSNLSPASIRVKESMVCAVYQKKTRFEEEMKILFNRSVENHVEMGLRAPLTVCDCGS